MGTLTPEEHRKLGIEHDLPECCIEFFVKCIEFFPENAHVGRIADEIWGTTPTMGYVLCPKCREKYRQDTPEIKEEFHKRQKKIYDELREEGIVLEINLDIPTLGKMCCEYISSEELWDAAKEDIDWGLIISDFIQNEINKRVKELEDKK